MTSCVERPTCDSWASCYIFVMHLSGYCFALLTQDRRYERYELFVCCFSGFISFCGSFFISPILAACSVEWRTVQRRGRASVVGVFSSVVRQLSTARRVPFQAASTSVSAVIPTFTRAASSAPPRTVMIRCCRPACSAAAWTPRCRARCVPALTAASTALSSVPTVLPGCTLPNTRCATSTTSYYWMGKPVPDMHQIQKTEGKKWRLLLSRGGFSLGPRDGSTGPQTFIPYSRILRTMKPAPQSFPLKFSAKTTPSFE